MGSKSPIGRISYRDQPSANTYPVKSAWKRLKRWSMANLPQYGDDSPPANDEQFREFEAAIGATLPKDMRDSYRVYDGQFAGSGIIYGGFVIPLSADSSGNHIAIDLNPEPKGTRGQVIVFGRDDEFHPVLALSWGQFLTDLADELEAGNCRLDTSGDPEFPEFKPDDPYKKHFHSVGMYWSRGKLGLRRLSAADQRRWDKRHGK